MASVAELKEQIKSINNMGREYLLSAHGYSLDENATTFDVVKSIGELPPLQYATDLSSFMMNAEIPNGTHYTLYTPNCNIFESMFSFAVGVEKIKFTALNVNKLLYMKNMFMYCQNLTEVDFNGLLLPCATLSSAFNNCSKLKKINAIFDVENIEESIVNFLFCQELEEIRFAEDTIHNNLRFIHSRKLSQESVESIIAGLKNITETHTLTFNVNISLTDEQKAIINDKGWSLVFSGT